MTSDTRNGNDARNEEHEHKIREIDFPVIKGNTQPNVALAFSLSPSLRPFGPSSFMFNTEIMRKPAKATLG